MTSKISAKFLEIFRNLKSDALPRPPRPETNGNQPTNPNNETDEQSENVDYSNPEEVFVSPGNNNNKSKSKSKPRKSSSSSNKQSTEVPEEEVNSTASSNVTTQATGNVINIVNSNNVRWGNEFVYYMGPVQGQHGPTKQSTTVEEEDDKIEKTDLIQLLLESTKKVDHEYLDYISKNLGKTWHRFFRKLGYKQGQIETVEIDMAKHGVAEARYKLLLDWIRNDDDGTVGRLATILWECEERHIVKELAAIHSQN
ncbi:protein immune deficiency isoform X2 [Aricia agestis]|uniref:protein immune deficiency isoform X2 n=1 Tax=Aricia agestis TaxID=91739 RepID=UPI001C203401|nr:protein immune deficiency isoform X2 [Aricia agestis]